MPVVLFAGLAGLLWRSNPPLQAQESRATILATVRTPAGTPVLGAELVAENTKTGESYQWNTNEMGESEIRDLPPGSYKVRISQNGFAGQTPQSVELVAGRPAAVAFVLEGSSGAAEGVPAPGQRSEARAAAASPSGQINENQLVGLPLNGRSYNQLATLQAGISDPLAADSSRGVGSGALTVSGGRANSNNFLLDGMNIMDSRNQVPRSAAGVQLGSEAVLQVQVLSTNYTAEYGRGSGGVLNSITRSGTPQFHGTVFEYFRNSKMDARNFFDDVEPRPFKRNQFGFLLTGPIRKDQTYFMVAYEGLRDRLTKTQVDLFPDQQIREGPVHPKVRGYLLLFPFPNGEVDPLTHIGENRSPQFLPTNENFFTVRLDQQISAQDSFFVRYNFDDATSYSSGSTFVFRTLSNSRQQYLTLVESHVFNPRVVNSFRFGYTRPVDTLESISSIAIPPSFSFVPGFPQLGIIDVPGLSSFGHNSTTPAANTTNTFQFADDVLVQRGDHSLRTGFEIHRYRWDLFSNSYGGGRWSFNSLDSFLRAGPEGTNLVTALPGADSSKAYRQTLLGLYVQDAYRLSSRWQVSFGLRYDFTSIIKDRYGRTTFLPDPARDSKVQIGPLIKDNPSLRNFSPRFGFSWSPRDDQKTLLSGGFGIYYDHLLEYVVDQAKSTAPFYPEVVRTNFDASTTFPDAVTAVQGTPLEARMMDYQGLNNPMVLRYNFSVQHDLPAGWRLRAAYVGARGNHLFRGIERNLFPVPVIQGDGTLFFPPNAGPRNPAFGSMLILSSDAQSFYNSLQLSAGKALSYGISLQANYTFSKSVDDASTFSFHGNPYQYPVQRGLERALSDFDIRHRLTLSYFYNLPLKSGQRWWGSGVWYYLFGDWRLGGIMSFRSGTPFTPLINVRTPGYLFAATRPHLLPGQDKNPVEGASAGCSHPGTNLVVVQPGELLGTRERYFDPCVYAVPAPGTLGTSGRNTVIAASVFNMDISLQKEFVIDSRRRLQFRAEFFNLPNHTNFSRVQGSRAIVFSGVSGRRNRFAGSIEDTATTARQIQFALRLSF